MIEFTPANMRTWSRLGSCGAYGLAMLALAEEIPSLAALTADLCFFSGLDRFKDKHSNKFYNVGIAEQNLLGVAAGFAKEGITPFASTYATFASMRCADQIRVNMGYMQLPIKLVGLTSGFSVGILGATHISIEDIAVIRSIPNVTILSPCDCTESIKAIIAAADTNEPTYIRLSGGIPNPMLYSSDYEFRIGKSIEIREGSDIAIIATGTMVHSALKAAEQLQAMGYSASVVNMHTIKPIDVDAINNCLSVKLIVTVEEHSTIGGLGSAVSEVLSGAIAKPPQLIIGVDDKYPHASSYHSLLAQYGLLPEQIAIRIANKMDSL